ncbi:MAG: OmpW family protein [Curvibacter sp.]|nr:OmpW family protein [Curvibacter sp.]
MKKQVMAVAALCALMSGAAFAQDGQGPWMVRARAVSLQSSNGDSTGLGLSINNKWLPEGDITYFFNKNIAAELILTVPQSQTLYSKGTAIGSFKHLPPTLLAQYHFDLGSFKPYVGAGINYTSITNISLPAGVSIDSSSWGAAIQAGVDIPLSNNLYFNFDVKKVNIRTGVYAAGSQIGTFKIDPLLVGVGLGWRF